MHATVARNAPTDVSEPIRIAVEAHPTASQKHKKEMLRYFVLVIALLAVVFLIAIAVYYTQGNAVTIEHVSSLTRTLPLSA
jgi:hypothetical protein